MPELLTEEWVGSDGSRYSIRDDKVSISTHGSAMELSATRLFTVSERWAVQSPRLAKSFPDPLGPFLLDVRKTVGGWRLLGGGIADNEHSQLWLFSPHISTDRAELTPDEAPRKIVRPERIRCWCALGGGRAAVGYASGKIEILALNEDPPRVLAVAFTLTPPDDLAVTRGPAGEHLVVLAGEVIWFNLASLIRHPD
jgi:hypothetical protein